MLLVIDTATAACSVALIDGEVVRHARSERVGRGHAERLVPMVDELLAEAGGAVPSAIVVDCGPGSFTGVRVGLAAAIGMGMGWNVPVTGCSSLALIAARRFAEDATLSTCAAALTGGHGEVFVQRFAAAPFRALTDLASLPPQRAALLVSDAVIAGSGAPALAEAGAAGTIFDTLPDASDAIQLPADFRALAPRPLYGRPPDAKPKAA